jgi:L-asparaginase II
MGKPIPMVELWRGGLLESTHLGHAVLVDDTGQIVQAWGNPSGSSFRGRPAR